MNSGPSLRETHFTEQKTKSSGKRMDLISYLVKINIEFEIGMKAEGESGVNYVVNFRNAKKRN